MEALNIELDTVQKEKNDTVSGLREKIVALENILKEEREAKKTERRSIYIRIEGRIGYKEPFSRGQSNEDNRIGAKFVFEKYYNGGKVLRVGRTKYYFKRERAQAE